MIYLLLSLAVASTHPIDERIEQPGIAVEYRDPSIPFFPVVAPKMHESILTTSRYWVGESLRKWQRESVTVDTTQELLPPGFRKILSLTSGRNRNEMLNWNGCDQEALVQGGQQDSTGFPKAARCTTSLLNNDFAKQISKYFLSCLQEGAREAGIPEPSSVFVMHASTYRANAMLHGSARAMDLTFVHFRDENGNVYFTFNTHKPYGERQKETRRVYEVQNRTVYDKFRSCWKKNLPIRGCTYTGGSIGYQGATPVAFNRGDHNDHIHLELAPNCGPVQIQIAAPRFQPNKVMTF